MFPRAMAQGWDLRGTQSNDTMVTIPGCSTASAVGLQTDTTEYGKSTPTTHSPHERRRALSLSTHTCYFYGFGHPAPFPRLHIIQSCAQCQATPPGGTVKFLHVSSRCLVTKLWEVMDVSSDPYKAGVYSCWPLKACRQREG